MSQRRKQLKDMTVDDLRLIIREELNEAIKSKVEPRLDRLEESIKQIVELRSTVTAMEESMNYTTIRLDDLHKDTLPALAKICWEHRHSSGIPDPGP